MANSTLAAIREKVRKITRSPSISQLTQAQLDEYINTFILLNFPAHLRLFSLRTTLTFYTQPNVDTYETSTNPNDPLYNFKNKYYAVHPYVYLAGIPGMYTQWRDVFYANWPITTFVQDTTLRTNGGAGPYAGQLTSLPVLQNNVAFSTLDTNGTAMILTDRPLNNVMGDLGIKNQVTGVFTVYGSINYITGVFTVSFPNLTLNNQIIYSETVPYQTGKPTSVLFFDNKFIIRPVPDYAYPVQIQVDIRPTELLLANDVPQIDQWWEYIALGAARKFFEDKTDIESENEIMPKFLEYQNLVNRTNIDVQANERTITIYTQGKGYGTAWWGPQWPY